MKLPPLTGRVSDLPDGVTDDTDVLHYVADIELASRWKMPKLFRYVFRVRRQLERTLKAPDGGLLSYSLEGDLSTNTFHTVAVFTDAAALSKFARTTPHGPAMQKLRDDLASFTTDRTIAPLA